MAPRIAAILLICSLSCVLAQYSDDLGHNGASPPKKPLQIPGARRIKGPRLSSAGSQSPIGVTPRFRRPISKPRPSAEPVPELPVFTSGIRGSRPSSIVNLEQSDEPASSLPIQTIQQPHIVHAQSIGPAHIHIPQQQQQPQQSLESLKPVSEVHEKDEDVVQVIANLGAVSGYGAQGNLLTPTAASPTPAPTASAYLHERQPQIQPIQYRPSPPQLQQISRSSPPNLAPEQLHQSIGQEQYRPQKAVRVSKPRQQIAERNEYDFNEARPVVKQRAQIAPKKSKPQSDYYEGRTKKPVAQVIRRYREETADGSIIWGFENDDGSFKEEIIGIDCITRGKYGYVDPDGVRREYTYETGIKCDIESQQQQDQDILNTFVDYQENKLVLPGGKTIDLSSMGKKQARRPQNFYRN